MTWEETIKFIRTRPEYQKLIELAYFEEELHLNVERFRVSEEYIETKKLINKYLPNTKTILDIGSGNGISAISFAIDGWNVTVSEPDKSDTIGAGAIRKLKQFYNLENIQIFEEFAENIDFGDKKFDVVYIRQAMHHAYDLNKFISNLSRYIKSNGLLVTIRDHVIFDENDKTIFLENHDLHKYYGGENAFTEAEYISAFESANLTVVCKLMYYESVINYFPASKEDIENLPKNAESVLKKNLKDKIHFFADIPLVFNLYKKKVKFSKENIYNEKSVPGRMYSFVCRKT
jgi:2-polyprenyl-3-methyl-5-hydroxy-6-metoxy-1,4-benzoquinol methylase